MRIVATQGRKHINVISKAEWDQYFSVACCISAFDIFVPSVFILDKISKIKLRNYLDQFSG